MISDTSMSTTVVEGLKQGIYYFARVSASNALGEGHAINPKDGAFLEVQQQLQQLELQQPQVQQQQSHQQPVTVITACSPNMNTKVSFSNLVEISTDTGRVPDYADADDANANADADEGFASKEYFIRHHDT
jgi:hypothetical protein